MRGTPSFEQIHTLACRIIPAHAGNSGNLCASSRLTADHPRACGELSSQEPLLILDLFDVRRATDFWALPARCFACFDWQEGNEPEAVELHGYSTIRTEGLELESGVIGRRPGDHCVAVADKVAHLGYESASLAFRYGGPLRNGRQLVHRERLGVGMFVLQRPFAKLSASSSARASSSEMSARPAVGGSNSSVKGRVRVDGAVALRAALDAGQPKDRHDPPRVAHGWGLSGPVDAILRVGTGRTRETPR